MANELKKRRLYLISGIPESMETHKLSMKIRAVGTTAGNIQERLGFMETVSSKYHASRACGKPIR